MISSGIDKITWTVKILERIKKFSANYLKLLNESLNLALHKFFYPYNENLNQGVSMSFTNMSPGTASPFYGGGQVQNPANVIQVSGVPSELAVSEDIGTIAIDPVAGNAYIAVQNTGLNGTITWDQLGLATGTVGEISPDFGIPALPLDGVIDFVSGTGIEVEGSANTVTFNVLGTGLATGVVFGTGDDVDINERIVTNNSGLVTVTLPTSAPIGSSIRITGLGAGGWLLQCNAGQIINSSGGSTSSGGALASTNRYDCVLITCVVTDTTWIAESIVGNLTNT